MRSPHRPSLAATSRILLLVGALATASCATSPFLRAAEAGQYEGLRATITEQIAGGRFSLSDAVAFARAIAKGEISRAKGEEGEHRIHEFASCAREVDGALSSRADTHDGAGAAAAMVLMEAGIESPSSYKRYARLPPDAPDAAFRALGARALDSENDAILRRKLIADPDQEVRRNALRAAMQAGDPGDVEPVLEAARVDPWPPARTQAIRAAGVIGGDRAVLALKDLWARSEPAVREAIADAWASRRAFSHGGKQELVWVMDTQHGKAAIFAANVLLRAGGDASVPALGVLERAIKEGPAADRVLAIESVPLRVAPLREAIAKAETDSDEAVSSAALVRRLEASPDEGGPKPGTPDFDAIVAKLTPIAAGSGTGATTARGALARAKVQAIVPILEKEGTSKDPKARAEAGVALAVYGDLPRAAVIAADPEPRVRTTVACAILRDWSKR
jgi:HEAT repeat protein